jgi:hypothetical protein
MMKRHEATQELFSGYRYLALLAAVRVILPAEGDLAVATTAHIFPEDGD